MGAVDWSVSRLSCGTRKKFLRGGNNFCARVSNYNTGNCAGRLPVRFARACWGGDFPFFGIAARRARAGFSGAFAAGGIDCVERRVGDA
ncbi:MAG: hypothetical protein DBX55_08690 [Verrucomicrobia bacterium]|nr:MAG: hypothetical protein DBX55_08690 [Verrucomicrobiota bacterium]